MKLTLTPFQSLISSTTWVMLAVFNSSMANATDSFLTGQFPVIAPQSCGYSLMHPENAAGAYHSADCKTVFILPPRTGTIRVASFSASENIRACAAVESNIASTNALSKKIQAITDELDNTDPTSPRFQVLTAAIATLEPMRASLSSVYAAVEGATTQMVIDNGMTEEFRNQYIVDNVNALQQGADITYVPISESYLSFTTKSPESQADAQRPAVLSISIPGIPPSNNAKAPGQILMNGAVSAQVVLSLEGACPAFRGQDTLKSTSLVANLETMNSFVAANFTYSVPVKTSFGYKASLDIDTMAKELYKYSATHTQFSVDDYVRSVQEGSVKTPFTFEWDQYEVPAGEKAQELAQDFIKQVYDRLADRLAERMKALGYLSLTEPTQDAVPPSGTVDVPTPQRICHRKKVLFVDVGESCENVIVNAKVSMPGTVEQFVQKINETHFDATESAVKNAVVQRVYTSTFTFTNSSKDK